MVVVVVHGPFNVFDPELPLLPLQTWIAHPSLHASLLKLHPGPQTEDHQHIYTFSQRPHLQHHPCAPDSTIPPFHRSRSFTKTSSRDQASALRLLAKANIPASMLLHQALLYVALAAFAVTGCRADADPDADPARAPRIREPEESQGALFAEEGAGVGGGDDYDYGLILRSVDPVQLFGCRGGNAFGFSLDASSSIVAVEFGEMQAEVWRWARAGAGEGALTPA